MDSIINPKTNPTLVATMQKLVGELLWLAQSTRPDIATITNLLAQHQLQASTSHIDAAKYVIRYLLGTKQHGK